MKSHLVNHTHLAFLRTTIIALLALTVVLAPISQSVTAATDSSLTASSAEAFLDEFFAAAHVQPHYVGASVVVVKDGEILAQKGYGYADQTTETAVDPANTVFRVASVSKSFTAVAVMQLVEQGKIDLQKDIRTYLPDLSFENPFQTPVTVGDLLAHTTGFEIRDPQPEDIHADFDRFVDIEDYVHTHMPPVVRQPGSSYMYDNFASLLAGLLVQEVSGEPYQDYMDKHVFEPLGMENSGFLLEGSLRENLAVGYDQFGEDMELYTVTPTVMPHGGMLTTAEDMGKFMISFLADAATDEKRILSEESVRMMEEYRHAIHPLFPDTTYGFEAPIQVPGAGSSSDIITKAGDLPGFSSYLFMIPEENTGVFLTYNQSGVLRNLFYPEFLAAFFPQYVEPADLGAFEPQTPEQLDRLSGYYSDLRLSTLVSTVAIGEDGELTISDGLLGLRSLQQVDENLFVDPISNQFIAFKVDEKGEGAYLKEPNLNPLGYAKKGETAVGFTDVNEQHPYAHYIFALQSLGHYPNDASQSFAPEQTVTRGEFIQKLLSVSNVPASPTEQLAFPDIVGHPHASYIQMAYELGMTTGDNKGNFGPDRAISREEAATMIWRLFQTQYPEGAFEKVNLTDNVSEWAVPAVQMMAALGLHGPEVEVNSGGLVDFKAKKELTRQEEAALLYALFTKPTFQMADDLATQQQAETDASLDNAS